MVSAMSRGFVSERLGGEEWPLANSCDVIIIGAGPAAAALTARGLNAAILERSNAVGAVWRRHYDRLHAH